MFTGLIQTVGQVSAVVPRGNYRRLTIVPEKMFDNLQIGESIAHSGVCLTVVSFDKNSFIAEASQVTTEATTLGSVLVGQKINLERALRADSLLGGHFVSGHIDTVLTIKQAQMVGESLVLNIHLPAKYSALVVDKGSVTIDGVSLTIVELGADSLAVNLIPETQGSTTLGSLKAGNIVNIEFDMIGKYIERFMNCTQSEQLTIQKLRNHGF